MNRFLARIAQHPPVAVLLALVAAGVVLAAATPVLGRGGAEAMAPLVGAIMTMGLGVRYQRRPLPSRDATRIKAALIVVCCVLIIVIILIAVPASK